MSYTSQLIQGIGAKKVSNLLIDSWTSNHNIYQNSDAIKIITQYNFVV